jgi:hypothetical protein
VEGVALLSLDGKIHQPGANEVLSKSCVIARDCEGDRRQDETAHLEIVPAKNESVKAWLYAWKSTARQGATVTANAILSPEAPGLTLWINHINAAVGSRWRN